ncbi:response regulator RpfG family c-di-GMP phosphodiesterase [Actimicrobium sp. GrIS 1.19]|uniref:HD domain-containing phosphohydrolase n=1 Tax=Actimicrobium sp. GrIS 1.19 TaxID=3071708 RepID=UPI002E030432|nr:response regulator RpfG family c-di-GMP phosphodiesterase [Actimicrobium sp. GrIS 1.19]
MNVLIVDDDPTNLSLFSHLLNTIPDLSLVTSDDPVDALAWCGEQAPDLVLVDYMMPVMDGLQFLQGLRALAGCHAVPVIMITSDMQSNVRHQALQMGANDFLTKPVDKIELRARVTNLLALHKAQQQLANRAEWLADEVRAATREILLRERQAIYHLARAAEYRDPETGAHLLRMANYARLLAANLGLSVAEQELIFEAAPMHDIGKVGIADAILLKPGRFTDEEMAIMRTHSQIGADILSGSSSPLLHAASVIALTHHEKWDGSGYPNGLRGERIALHGRIVAVADVFDALTSVRPYKPAWEIDRAAALIRDSAGTHFDPACVAAFFKDWDAILDIHNTHGDP